MGEVGEIVVRGHNVMKGYYKKPGATEIVIVDGWFHTGDLAKMDEDGYFFIVDRKKDLIIRGGMNIYPREIEEVIYAHPDVVEVCVIGVADAARGEEVKAYVALRNGADTTARRDPGLLPGTDGALQGPEGGGHSSGASEGAHGETVETKTARDGTRRVRGNIRRLNGLFAVPRGFSALAQFVLTSAGMTH